MHKDESDYENPDNAAENRDVAAQNPNMAAESPPVAVDDLGDVAENPGIATENPGVVGDVMGENPSVVNIEAENLESARGSAEVYDLMEEAATGEQPVHLYV